MGGESLLLNLIGMSYESKKNAHLYRHLWAGTMTLAGHQINLIDVNFHLQKFWKFLIKIQLTESNLKMTRG